MEKIMTIAKITEGLNFIEKEMNDSSRYWFGWTNSRNN